MHSIGENLELSLRKSSLKEVTHDLIRIECNRLLCEHFVAVSHVWDNHVWHVLQANKTIVCFADQLNRH